MAHLSFIPFLISSITLSPFLYPSSLPPALIHLFSPSLSPPLIDSSPPSSLPPLLPPSSEVYEQLVSAGLVVPQPEKEPPTIPMDYSWAQVCHPGHSPGNI